MECVPNTWGIGFTLFAVFGGVPLTWVIAWALVKWVQHKLQLEG
jgi:hypothetical protein